MWIRSLIHRTTLFCILLCFFFFPSIVSADDWPQWRGVNRDGKSNETGLLSSWPDGGPPLLWKTEGAGTGYSSMSVSQGRILTMGNRGDDEYVLSFSSHDGKPLWQVRSGRAYRNGRGSGPRATPTVDGDLVYALGANGDLSCLRISDGEKVWHVNILEKFGGKNIRWGISESVLIEQEKVICSPGGNDQCIIAFNKKTGQIIWKSKGLSDRPSYASAVPLTVDGVRQIVHFTGSSAAGVRVTDGSLLWQYGQASNVSANCATPVVQNNFVFVTSGYGTGCALLELSSEDGITQAEEVYFNKVMKNHHGGVVLVDGYIYGYSNKLVCLDFLTGERQWREDGPGKCSLIYAEGNLYCLSENGVMALIEANPDSYVEKGRFIFKTFDHFKVYSIAEEDEKPVWSRPVIANGKLLLRDQDNIYCYDIKDAAQAANR